MSPLIRHAAGGGKPVHVFGEMVSLLWEAGLVNAAIDVEAIVEPSGGQYQFPLLCAYPAQSAGGDHHKDALTGVCRAHAAAAGEAPGNLGVDGQPSACQTAGMVDQPAMNAELAPASFSYYRGLRPAGPGGELIMDDQERLMPAQAAPAMIKSCWICGIHLPVERMVADGGSACTDVRWYCRDMRACTERWTAHPPSVAQLQGAGRGTRLAGLTERR